jgi:hypothetical protein
MQPLPPAPLSSSDSRRAKSALRPKSRCGLERFQAVVLGASHWHVPLYAAAIAEVLFAFVFVHLAFRAIKQFTSLGRLEGAAHLNFTPGVVMILFTVGVLLLCRRSFPAYGLGLARLGEKPVFNVPGSI